MPLAPPLYQKRIRQSMSTVETVSVPAPLGGLNTIDPGFGMPDLDCPLLYNMIGAENGQRSRLGWKEWCTGLVGIADNTVRSILPFAGSNKNGSNDRLFACTSKGIYDVSASSASPTLVVTFGTQSGDAGYGISCVAVNTSGGHFLLYCDEENGYYTYSEVLGTWTKPVSSATTPWAVGTIYGPGAAVSNGGLTYVTAAGGTAAAAPATGPSGTGASIADNTVTWAYTPSVGGVDPAKCVHVMVWKNRVWLTEKNTGNAWFLPIGAIFGPGTRQNFGPQFRAGGDLRGLWNWTLDGGSGPDDRLVAISGGGDVVIYAGTDPATVGGFGIVGKWYCGGVPYGRRIATDHGGDLLLLTSLGILPISALILGNPIFDKSPYATRKIANLFNRMMAAARSLRGWALRLHPEDNSLLVTVPVADGQNTNQLAMSMVTRGWAQYRDLPMLSMEAWGGLLYFGTADGRVCVNTAYIDGVLLSDPSAFTPIDCSGITRFSNLGSGSQKGVTIIRPTIISEGGSVPSKMEARYGYNLTEASRPVAVATTGTTIWDSALWDAGKWGGAYATQQQAVGATGMGPNAAIAFRLLATSRTVLVGWDVSFVAGGML